MFTLSIFQRGNTSCIFQCYLNISGCQTADRKPSAGVVPFSEGCCRHFPFMRGGIKRRWKETNIPPAYCSMKPMRPNVLTAFRRVNIWWNVREFCVYFERSLEGAQTVHTQGLSSSHCLLFTLLFLYYAF